MDSKRILILGGAGMLGHKVWLTFKDQFDTYVTFRKPFEKYSRLKIFDPSKTFAGITTDNKESFKGIFNKIKPDFVINCIGVVAQLPEAKDPIISLKVNALWPHELEKICHECGAKLIHISTDCVFSGNKGNYSEDDPTDARDLYGQTKAMGELHNPPSLTIRTSIVGRSLEASISLLDWFFGLRPKEKIRGFTQVLYNGLTTIRLSETLAWIIQKHPDLSGLYQIASQPIAKYDLLKKLQKAFGLDIEITPFDDFRCDRSLNGSHFNKATCFSPPSWDEMIEGLVKENSFYQGLKNAVRR